jgi:GntR family transcriptional regulator
MLPFSVTLVAGESPYRQIVYAATKAVVAGDLAPGSPFPSVRELSQALKINPNTAHKVVAELVRDGLLEVLPGVGTVVARGNKATAAQKRALLSRDVESLLVEAKRLGLTHSDVENAVRERWLALFGNEGRSSTELRTPGSGRGNDD